MKTLILISIITVTSMMTMTSCKKDKIEKKDTEPADLKADTISIKITMGTTALNYMEGIEVQCDCEIIQDDRIRNVIVKMKPGNTVKIRLKDWGNSYQPFMGPITYKVFKEGVYDHIYSESKTSLYFEYKYE